MLKSIVFVLATIAIVSCAVKERSKGCEYGHLVIPFGETKGTQGDSKECLRITCNADSSVSAVGCPLAQPGPGCTFSDEDPSKPYPDCCPQIKC